MRTDLAEIPSKTGVSGNRCLQSGFPNKEHPADQRFDGVPDAFLVSCSRFNLESRASDQVVNSCLMREDHQGNQVTIRSKVRLRVEAGFQAGYIGARCQIQAAEECLG